MSQSFYKYVFIASGLLNFAIATMLIFFTDFFVAMFQLGVQPVQPVFAHILGTLVFSLGVAYFWIAKNPSQNKPLIWLGIISKFTAVIVIVADVLLGVAATGVLNAIGGDIVFGLLFLWIVRRL